MGHRLIRHINDHPLASIVAIACDKIGCSNKNLIVSAVSGGSDSTALALLITPYAMTKGCKHILAYFDHGIDPERHAKEWEHVCELARRLGIESLRGDTGDYSDIHGEGPEDQWRNRRYAFLFDVADQHGTILTAHTREDNVESFLLAAIRGGPGSGLGGIRPVRSDCIRRPFLSLSRTSLREFLHSLGISWIEDPSNKDISGARSYIRHVVVSKLVERFGSEAIDGLHRSARTCARNNEFIDEFTQTIMSNLWCESETGERILDLSVFGQYHEALKHHALLHIFDVLYRGERIAIAPHMERLKQVISGKTRAVSLPQGVQARREGSHMVFTSLSHRFPPPWVQEPLSIPGWTPLPILNGGIRTTMVWAPAGIIPSLPPDTRSALIDMDELGGCLHIRRRRHGERFTPLGFPYGKVKLKKYLRDKGIPAHRRWSHPVIADRKSGRLVWIPGVARSNVGRISDRTRHYIHLRFVSDH